MFQFFTTDASQQGTAPNPNAAYLASLRCVPCSFATAPSETNTGPDAGTIPTPTTLVNFLGWCGYIPADITAGLKTQFATVTAGITLQQACLAIDSGSHAITGTAFGTYLQGLGMPVPSAGNKVTTLTASYSSNSTYAVAVKIANDIDGNFIELNNNSNPATNTSTLLTAIVDIGKFYFINEVAWISPSENCNAVELAYPNWWIPTSSAGSPPGTWEQGSPNDFTINGCWIQIAGGTWTRLTFNGANSFYMDRTNTNGGVLTDRTAMTIPADSQVRVRTAWAMVNGSGVVVGDDVGSNTPKMISGMEINYSSTNFAGTNNSPLEYQSYSSTSFANYSTASAVVNNANGVLNARYYTPVFCAMKPVSKSRKNILITGDSIGYGKNEDERSTVDSSGLKGGLARGLNDSTYSRRMTGGIINIPGTAPEDFTPRWRSQRVFALLNAIKNRQGGTYPFDGIIFQHNNNTGDQDNYTLYLSHITDYAAMFAAEFPGVPRHATRVLPRANTFGTNSYGTNQSLFQLSSPNTPPYSGAHDLTGTKWTYDADLAAGNLNQFFNGAKINIHKWLSEPSHISYTRVPIATVTLGADYVYSPPTSAPTTLTINSTKTPIIGEILVFAPGVIPHSNYQKMEISAVRDNGGGNYTVKVYNGLTYSVGTNPPVNTAYTITSGSACSLSYYQDDIALHPNTRGHKLFMHNVISDLKWVIDPVSKLVPYLLPDLTLPQAAVTGNQHVGDVLTLTTGPWVGEDTITTQVKRDGVAIGGATALTYTRVSGDVDHTLTWDITATNSVGSTVITVTPAITLPLAIYQFVATIAQGSGAVFNCTYTGYNIASVTYQWKLDGVDISGQTASSYTGVAGDVGHNLTCAVTATGTYSDSQTVTSNTITVTGIAGFSASIAGTSANNVLTVSYVGTGIASVTYQWQENISGTWTDISMQTATTYTMVVGSNPIRCVVSATGVFGDSATANSGSLRPFIPTDITTGNSFEADLEDWFDAGDASTITQVANLVSRWNSKSSNSRAGYTITTQPGYDGANGRLTFNGSQYMEIRDSLLNPTTIAQASDSGWTVIGCLSYDGATLGTNKQAIVLGDAGAQGSTAVYPSFGCVTDASVATNIKGQSKLGSSSPTWGSGSGNTPYIPTNTKVVETLRFKSGSVGLKGIVSSSADVYAAGAETTSPVGTASSTAATLYIGGPGSGSRKHIGSVYELLFVKAYLSTANLQKAEAYVCWKNGVNPLMHANHPYKNSFPKV
jgi:hypothetical protein